MKQVSVGEPEAVSHCFDRPAVHKPARIGRGHWQVQALTVTCYVVGKKLGQTLSRKRGLVVLQSHRLG